MVDFAFDTEVRSKAGQFIEDVTKEYLKDKPEGLTVTLVSVHARRTGIPWTSIPDSVKNVPHHLDMCTD